MTPFKRLITGKRQPGRPGRSSEARGGSSRSLEDVAEMEGAPPAKRTRKATKSATAAKVTPKGRGVKVEFTLTKLQEDLLEQKARDKLLVLTKILTKATETKYLQFQTSPANPYKANYTPANFSKNKITPKASQTADLNCLNFKLAVPTSKVDHTQKFMSNQVKPTPKFISS